MIHLRMFGPGELESDHGEDFSQLLAQPKRFALLCYLALPEPGTMHRRDTLLNCFWPGDDHERSRMALRQALSQIRRNVGNEAIIRRGAEEVAVNPEIIRSDITEFEAAFNERRWVDAVRCYQGEFLEGLGLPNAHDFTNWLHVQRTRLAGHYVFAVEELANAATASGHTRAAVQWWQALVQHDPYNSRYGMEYMRALERDNDPANALSFARQHTQLLHDEFGIAPPREFEMLVEQMLREHCPSEPRQVVWANHVGNGPDSEVRSSAPPDGGAFPELARARNRPRNPAQGWLHMLGMGVGAILLILIGAVGGNIVFDDRREFNAERVMVMPFENRTADSAVNTLGFLAADWIAQALQQGGIAEVVPVTFSRILAESEAVLGTGNVAVTAAEQEHASFIVCGSIFAIRDSLRFHVELIDVVNSRSLQAFDTIWHRDRGANAIRDLAQRVGHSVAAELVSARGFQRIDLEQVIRPDG